jgi:hypothetical protein
MEDVKVKRLLAFFLLIVGLFSFDSYAQKDFEFPDFACLPSDRIEEYKGISKATCKIAFTNNLGLKMEGSGVLVNNTEKKWKTIPTDGST